MDKNIFGDIDNVPDEEKRRMSIMVEQLQMRDKYVSISFVVTLFVCK